MRWLVFTLAAACIYLALRPRTPEADAQEAGQGDETPALGAFELPSIPDPLPYLEDALNRTTSAVRSALGAWRPPAKYAEAIRQAEDANGIPRDVLARLLWQESRYRDDIISGRVKSPAGASGIAQFMPDTAPEWAVNLYDGNPFDDIAGAGRYLAWLYKRHGNWTEALAAYNWGTGNVARKGLARAPLETRNYYGQILADVNAANGTAWA